METPSLPNFTALITALQTSITPTMLLTILASVVGVGVAFVLMWFGVRKITSAFIAAVTKGKLKI